MLLYGTNQTDQRSREFQNILSICQTALFSYITRSTNAAKSQHSVDHESLLPRTIKLFTKLVDLVHIVSYDGIMQTENHKATAICQDTKNQGVMTRILYIRFSGLPLSQGFLPRNKNQSVKGSYQVHLGSLPGCNSYKILRRKQNLHMKILQFDFINVTERTLPIMFSNNMRNSHGTHELS